MKEYYETKLARYSYILAALDKQIAEDAKAAVTHPDLDHAISVLENLRETRKLVIDDLEFIKDRIAECTEAEKKEETV